MGNVVVVGAVVVETVAVVVETVVLIVAMGMVGNYLLINSNIKRRPTSRTICVTRNECCWRVNNFSNDKP